MTEILIIGASGLLGQHLLNEAEARHCSVTGTYFSEEVAGLVRLDIQDAYAVDTIIRRTRPDIVMLSAAMTSIGECEKNRSQAQSVNAEAPLEVAKTCRRVGAKMVLFSTANVFDGKSESADENLPPNPVSTFGKTRLQGELNVLGALPDSLVIRTCMNFGWNRLRSRENEVTRLIHEIRCGKRVELSTARWTTPSYAPDVAKHLFDLLRMEESGIYHVATKSRLTEYDMGMRVCEAFSLDKGKLLDATTGEAKMEDLNPRRLCLSTTKVEKKLDTPMNSVERCLAEMSINH